MSGSEEAERDGLDGVHTDTADCDCEVCKCDLYMSAVVSDVAPGRCVCPDHAAALSVPTASCKLLFRSVSVLPTMGGDPTVTELSPGYNYPASPSLAMCVALSTTNKPSALHQPDPGTRWRSCRGCSAVRSLCSPAPRSASQRRGQGSRRSRPSSLDASVRGSPVRWPRCLSARINQD